MTVNELRAVLATLPDDAPVLVNDEGYVLACGTACEVGRGLARGKVYYTRWFGNANHSLGEHPVRALVIHG